MKWKKDSDREEALEAIQDVFRSLNTLGIMEKHLNNEKPEVRNQAKFEKELATNAIKSDLQRIRYLLEK